MEIGHEIFRALGMTLVHSLWQGAILAVFILFALGLVNKSNARARYLVLCSGLYVLLAGFVITFITIYRYSSFADTLQYALQADQVQNNAISPTPVSLTGKLFELLEPWYASIATFWLAGFLLMGFRLAGGAFLARYKFRKDLVVPESGLLERFDSLKERMNLSFRITLRISYRMISPLVTGIICPMVIIPSAAITGLSTDQIRAVMVHELAHIKRFDHLMIILQAIAQQILFFHPVTWFLIPEIDRERENCCDDYVIHNNNNIIHYVKALAMIQEMNLQNAPVNGLTGKSNQLLNRIKRLIKPEMKHSNVFRLAILLLFTVTMSVSALAIIVSDKHDVKNNLADETITTTIQNNMDGDKKKMTVVFENDTIREMKVNGKHVSRDEMKEYAAEIRKMQEELESSHGELDDMKEHLMELQIEREMALQDMRVDELIQPKLEELKHLWENEEFNENMRKTHEEAWKSHEEAWKNMEEARKLHKENWDLNQDEFKLQWEQFEKNQDEYKLQWNKAKEAAEKAIEELKKNGTLDEDFEFHFNLSPGIPVFPPVPDIEMVPPVPHIEMVPPVPHIEMTPPIPHIEMTPAVPHVAPVVPHVEIPETPEVPDAVIPEEESGNPAKDNAVKESLDSKLRELEE